MLKFLFVLFIVSSVSMILVFYVTPILDKKPKSNKFRQWWNKHVVDMDNNYEE
jgi:hypothetical protein